jgi:hypothetical protein
MQMALFLGLAFPIVLDLHRMKSISTSSPAAASSPDNTPAADSLWRCSVRSTVLDPVACVPCHGRRRPAIHDFCAVRCKDVDGAPAHTMTREGRCSRQVIRLFCLGP